MNKGVYVALAFDYTVMMKALVAVGVMIVIGMGVFVLRDGAMGVTPEVSRQTISVSEPATTSPVSEPVEAPPKKVVSPETKPASAPVIESSPDERGWKEAVATVFWVGEDATGDNGYIHNSASAFDREWETNFGGVDDPDDRCGYAPCGFTPKENSFYVALPYTDRADSGGAKENAAFIPWYDPNVRGTQIKNRWIEVRAEGKSCFAQWQDVGPFETDDVAYVFGESEQPRNAIGVGAGIDLSPAVRDCLGVGGVSRVSWRHVEESDVPEGPWLAIVTR